MKVIISKKIIIFWVSLSIFCLSFAIVLLSIQLKNLNNNIPIVVNEFNEITRKVDNITINELPKFQEQLITINSYVPMYLEEFTQLRKKTIPGAIQQAQKFRNEIPALLNRIDTITKYIPVAVSIANSTNTNLDRAITRLDSIEYFIPPILEIAKNSIETIDKATLSINSFQAQIPYALEIITTTNDSINSYVNKTGNIVSDFDGIAKQAGKNASLGLIWGVLTIPFNIFKGLSKLFKNKKISIDKKEILKIEKLLIEFLNQNNISSHVNWFYKGIKKTGTISLENIFENSGQLIKEIKLELRDKQFIELKFVQKDDGFWELLE